jgi:hypothetical protein
MDELEGELQRELEDERYRHDPEYMDADEPQPEEEEMPPAPEVLLPTAAPRSHAEFDRQQQEDDDNLPDFRDNAAAFDVKRRSTRSTTAAAAMYATTLSQVQVQASATVPQKRRSLRTQVGLAAPLPQSEGNGAEGGDGSADSYSNFVAALGSSDDHPDRLQVQDAILRLQEDARRHHE